MILKRVAYAVTIAIVSTIFLVIYELDTFTGESFESIAINDTLFICFPTFIVAYVIAKLPSEYRDLRLAGMAQGAVIVLLSQALGWVFLAVKAFTFDSHTLYAWLYIWGRINTTGLVSILAGAFAGLLAWPLRM